VIGRLLAGSMKNALRFLILLYPVGVGPALACEPGVFKSLPQQDEAASARSAVA